MTPAWDKPLVEIRSPAEEPPDAGRPPAEDRSSGEAALDAWLGDLRPRLVRLAWRYLWNAHDAEEIAQDAMAMAWREAGRQPAWVHRDAWLYRVTINLCLNRLRRVQAGPLPPDETLAARRPEEPLVETDELTRRVRGVIRELPNRQQAALVLRDIEGLAYEQIAAVLEIRKGAARLLVHRARETLRRVLLQRWPDSFT